MMILNYVPCNDDQEAETRNCLELHNYLYVQQSDCYYSIFLSDKRMLQKLEDISGWMVRILYIYSVALSPQANYTDWATATCRRNLMPTFVDRGVSRSQRGGSPTVVNLSFLDWIQYHIS
jgi:hypothetical protein